MILAIFLFFLILYAIELWFQKSFIAPCALLLLSFVMAAGLIAVNTENWEVVIYDEFPVYIFTAVLAFAAGCFLVEVLCYEKTGPGESQVRKDIVFGDRYPAIPLAALTVACGLAYLYMLTKDISFSDGINKALRAIYIRATTESTGSFIENQMLEIVIAASKISVFQLFVIKYFGKRKLQKAFIFIPILVAMICIAFSTDRNIFLRLFIYAACLWVLFYSGSIDENKRKKNWHIFKYAIVLLAVLVTVFYGLGKAKGYTSNFERMIGIYGGSGLYNFNIYLHNFSGRDLQLGNSTFSTLQNTLRALGLIDGKYSNILVVDEMIVHYSSNGYIYDSNVYSAMRPYLEDFGYLGMFIYPFIMGAFFELLYWFSKTYIFGFSWICYALLIYPVLFFTILEQFFKRFHLGYVYEIMWPLVFYLLIYDKNGIWRIRQTRRCEKSEDRSR